MEKAVLANPAYLHPDCGRSKSSLPPERHQAGVLPPHQHRCAAVSQALQLGLCPTTFQILPHSHVLPLWVPNISLECWENILSK